MDARARRRQRTHARASLVHRAYFFINASARARRSPADAISSVRPSVRSFVRAFPRVVRVRSRALLLESRSRVTTDALERRERARARAATTNDDRPTDRPTTDDRPTRGKCQMSEYTYLYCTLKTTKYPYRIHTSHMGIYTLHYGPRTHRARTRALEPKGFDKPLDRIDRRHTHARAMASTSFARFATHSRAVDRRRAPRRHARGSFGVTRAEAETAGSAIGPDSTEVRMMRARIAREWNE